MNPFAAPGSLGTMSVRTWWIAVTISILTVSACQNTPEPESFPRADNWHDIMEHVIEPGFDELLEAAGSAGMNHDALADRAESLARHMALGYGEHDQSNIASFAMFAREAEQWFLEIARAARARDEARFTDLVIEGQAQHCDRCHDAAGE